MESVNLLANTSFEPSDSWNFFANSFGTRIPLFKDECLKESIERKFTEFGKENVGAIGLSRFGEYNTDGSLVANKEFPFEMMFMPNQDIVEQFGWTDKRQEDANGELVMFYDQLTQIPEGTILFEVMARDVPDDINVWPQGSTVAHIANIRMTS